MTTINHITQSQLRELLTYSPWTGEFYWLSGRRQGERAGSVSGGRSVGQYVVIKINRKNYYAHRLAFIWMGFDEPEEVDHRNFNKTCNTWRNIRAATSRTNKYNMLIDAKNKHGLKGVHWDNRSQSWRACISLADGKQIKLGPFPSKEMAHEAYCKLAAEIHGEFARGI